MNIAWYSYYRSPWKDLFIKTWYHHADIMNLLGKEFDINIYPLLKPTNDSNIKKYNNGDKSVIVPGYETINFKFNSTEDFSYLNEIDACFLEVSRSCICGIPDSSEEAKEFADFLERKVKYLMERNIPILWYDGDADLFLKAKGQDNFNIEFYEKLNMDSYKNLTVVGPYEFGLNNKSEFVNINKFRFVPYNINFENVYSSEINNADKRNYISTYIGNNFKRSNFYEIFNNVSNFGNLRIYGDRRWNDKFLKDNIELNSYVKPNENGFKDYFDESLIGLYGSSESAMELQHYTLRIIEYLISGIYIVPCNYKYLIEKFPDNNLTTDDFKNDSIQQKLNNLRSNYVGLVTEQRCFLEKTFDSRKLCKIYKEAFGIKEEDL